MNTAVYTTKNKYTWMHIKVQLITVGNLEECDIHRQVEQIEVEVSLEKHTSGRKKKTRFLSHRNSRRIT